MMFIVGLMRSTKIQTGGKMLLYHYHVIKIWVENLLTRVLNEDKDRVWTALHVLMFFSSKIYFEENLR